MLRFTGQTARAAVLLPLGAALVLSACTRETAIRIVIETDIPLGSIVEELTVEVTRGEETIWTRRIAADASDMDSLASVVEAPDDDLEPEVDILVLASGGGAEVLRAGRRSAFLRGERFSETFCLWARCIGSTSRPCSEARCDAPDEDGGTPQDSGGDVGADGGDGAPDGSSGDADDDGGTCAASCVHRVCGDDGCGGQCGPPCADGAECNEAGQCVRWITVGAGSFQMGSPEDELGRVAQSEGRGWVVLTRSYELLQTEVDHAWFMAVMGYNPSPWGDRGAGWPIDSLMWHEAALFCNNLSILRGLEPCYSCTGGRDTTRCELQSSLTSPYECEGYRLPTEAEWEHAARAGTTTATYNGDLDPAGLGCASPNPVLDPIAWFCGNEPSERPHPVAELAPNPWLFHDVLGNVAEITHDYYADRVAAGGSSTDPWGPPTGTYRTARGGSVYSSAQVLRAAARMTIQPASRVLDLGLRPARTLPE